MKQFAGLVWGFMNVRKKQSSWSEEETDWSESEGEEDGGWRVRKSGQPARRGGGTEEETRLEW